MRSRVGTPISIAPAAPVPEGRTAEDSGASVVTLLEDPTEGMDWASSAPELMAATGGTASLVAPGALAARVLQLAGEQTGHQPVTEIEPVVGPVAAGGTQAGNTEMDSISLVVSCLLNNQPRHFWSTGQC